MSKILSILTLCFCTALFVSYVLATYMNVSLICASQSVSLIYFQVSLMNFIGRLSFSPWASLTRYLSLCEFFVMLLCLWELLCQAVCFSGCWSLCVLLCQTVGSLCLSFLGSLPLVSFFLLYQALCLSVIFFVRPYVPLCASLSVLSVSLGAFLFSCLSLCELLCQSLCLSENFFVRLSVSLWASL